MTPVRSPGHSPAALGYSRQTGALTGQHSRLPEGQACPVLRYGGVGRGPSADQMNGLLACPLVVRAPHRLAVDGPHLSGEQLGQPLAPLQEAFLELVRVQTGEHIAKGVVGRDSIGEDPLGRSRKERNHSSLLLPNNSTYTQESAPQMTAQRAMVMMSSSWCRLQRSILGSSKAPRHSPIEVFLPSLIAPPIHLHNPGFLLLAKSAIRNAIALHRPLVR